MDTTFQYEGAGAPGAHSQQAITAGVFIHREVDGVTQVFLAKRTAAKQFMPDVYELPGGPIDTGEGLLFGLAREIRETLDMSVSIGDPFAAFTYTNDSKGTHVAKIIYFATFIDDVSGVKLDPANHSGYDWFSKQDVLDRRNEIIPPAKNLNGMYDTGEPDPEYLSILKGFDLLAGAPLNKGV